MLLCGHQPNYLPYLGFFHKLALCDRFLIVDNVQYVKRGPFGWIHRNRIRTVTGWTWLSVPILTRGKFDQHISEAQINNREPWRRKHWRAIELNYGKAPHFARYRDGFHAVYDQPWDRLVDLAEALIRVGAECLGISKPISRSSAVGAEGPAVDLILSMCRRTGADRYLSGVHGRDYLGDLAPFREAGVRVLFQRFTHPVYPQCQPGPFISHLSFIDALFNVGPATLALIQAAGGHEEA